MSTIDDYADLRDFLKQSADDKYRDFSMKICTSKHLFGASEYHKYESMPTKFRKKKLRSLLQLILLLMKKFYCVVS